jgi:hypothetical protein
MLGIGLGIHSGKRSLLTRLSAIFRGNNYDGFVYFPRDISSVKQDSAGTTAGAINSPLGMILDKHLGLGLGAEQVSALTNFTAGGTNGASVVISAASVTLKGNSHAYVALPASAGGWEVMATLQSATDATMIELRVGTGVAPSNQYSAYTYTAAGSKTIRAVVPVGSTSQVWLKASYTSGDTAKTAVFTSVSIRSLAGNHSIQATAPARPGLKQDVNGKVYAELLGTDDNLTSATGGGGSAGGFWCIAMKPTGGAGTLRTIWADNGTNTGYKVQHDASNKLSLSAGNNTAFTTKASTVTVNVGTPYVLTAKDNGTNLSVQINNATAETVARPVVVAGTAGFTIGKDNGAASSFDIADIYAMVYVKNACPSAASEAIIKAAVAAEIGMTL